MKQSAFVIPFDTYKGKFLIGQRIDLTFDFFGGTMEKKEKPIETACREFFEETGTKIKKNELIPFKKIKGKDKTIHTFLLMWKKTRNIRKLDTNEHYEYKWVHVKQIMTERIKFSETGKLILFALQGFK